MLHNPALPGRPTAPASGAVITSLRGLLRRLFAAGSPRPDYVGGMLRDHPDLAPETLSNIL